MCRMCSKNELGAEVTQICLDCDRTLRSKARPRKAEQGSIDRPFNHKVDQTPKVSYRSLRMTIVDESTLAKIYSNSELADKLTTPCIVGNAT
eukprot:s470_g2.t1